MQLKSTQIDIEEKVNNIILKVNTKTRIKFSKEKDNIYE